ncbi:MAG TPA: hypothetical protein VFV93_16295 [Thermomicrobiales bacterium]|nr:hypothetical protein [Thermomicrobiales bacterium]
MRRTANPTRRGDGGSVASHDTTLNAALGCAAAVALVVVVILIVYLWTL